MINNHQSPLISVIVATYNGEKYLAFSIDEVLDKYFKCISPTLLSIVVEVMDEEIIKSIDFSKHKPRVSTLKITSLILSNYF